VDALVARFVDEIQPQLGDIATLADVLVPAGDDRIPPRLRAFVHAHR
jgi:hypothetical protein